MNYTWRQFDKDAKKIAKIFKDREVPSVNIYGVPRGGLILAVRLSHLLKLPMILDPKNITKRTLIVDDISDSGKTLYKVKDNCIVTLFWHPLTITKPNITIREKKTKWIIFPWEK